TEPPEPDRHYASVVARHRHADHRRDVDQNRCAETDHDRTARCDECAGTDPGRWSSVGVWGGEGIVGHGVPGSGPEARMRSRGTPEAQFLREGARGGRAGIVRWLVASPGVK